MLKAIIDVLLSLYPAAAPERVATIHVAAGAEVFTVTFAGHASSDFTYDDASRSDVLRERIDLAAAATLGPTRVILERAGGSIVSSAMIIDPDGPHRYEDARVRWPLRRLKARIMRRHVDRRVVDFPARAGCSLAGFTRAVSASAQPGNDGCDAVEDADDEQDQDGRW